MIRDNIFNVNSKRENFRPEPNIYYYWALRGCQQEMIPPPAHV